MFRRLGRYSFVLVVGALATVLGLGAALTLTPPGRALLARVITDQSDRLVRGGIEVARVNGTFVSSLVLDSVVVRDTSGALLALFPRVDLRYRLGSLLTGQVVFSRVHLTQPRIHLVKHRDGRMNYEEVLRLGEGPDDGPPALVVFRDVRIDDGIVTVRVPWNPPGHLRTEAQRDSALRAQRAVHGRRIEDGGADGLVQVRTAELAARLGEFRVSTPARDPLRVVVDSFAARLNDPLLVLTDLRGELTTARDTLWFTLERATMPRTRLTGDGLMAWPRDSLLFNFEFDAPEVALHDLRFVSPDFPDLTGSGRVIAYSFSGMETQYELPGLRLADATSRVSGSLTALTHKIRGLGWRGLDLTLANLDLEAVRPYLDTLPYRGRLSGRLRADGYNPSMQVDFDWTFFDDRIEGQPPNRIAMTGEVALGGDEGMVFRGTRVTAADLDLATMRIAAPAVVLDGRVTGEGTLEGPWRNVVFTGRMNHRDGDRPESVASGRFGLDVRREVTAFDADFAFAPLDFEGVRRTFPTLTAQGRVWGPVRLRGPADRMEVVADLQGEIGRVQGDGVVTATPPRWGADSLRLVFEDLDLAAVRGQGPESRLNGTLVLRGVTDSAVAPDGSLALALTAGRLREFRFDSAAAEVTSRDSMITVRGARWFWPGGSATARGSLGWARPYDGRLEVSAAAGTLAPFDALVTALAEREADSAGVRRPMTGSAEGTATIAGALDGFDLEAEVAAPRLTWDEVDLAGARGLLRLGAGRRPTMSGTAAVDTLTVGRMRFGGLEVRADGLRDSLTWHLEGRGGGLSALDATGEWRAGAADAGAEVTVRDVDLRLAASRWRLVAPTALRLADSIEVRTPLRLETRDGGASLEAVGALPYRGEGELDLRLMGLDIRDIYAALQRDTALARGFLQGDLRVGGTGRAPTIRGSVALTGPVFGDFRAPLMRAALSYRNRRLDANLTLWRTGRSVMDVGATLPLELAWLGVTGPRQLPGQLAIRAQADSMDLAALEAFTPNLRRVRGTMHVDAAVSGAWDAPRLGGTIDFRGGYGTVPGLGVTYGPVNGQLSLSADSILVDSLRVGGETGHLDVAGHIQLERLTRPLLDLELTGRSFRVMNVPDFLTLEADGELRLFGPAIQPLMTGSATARNSVLYFRDLITKEIVDLEDPLYADLVDVEAIRRRRLGSQFQSRFLDSLAIRNFRFFAAERVWLRSNEANIQMEGSVTVNKTRRQYRLEGTFNAQRGTYTLHLGPVTRNFEVERGVVRYFGTPNLDAALDVEARHVIKASEGNTQDLAVIARITGTLLTPKLSLESTIRPPLSQSDIVSLLILGRPLNSQVATTQQSQNYQTAIAVLAGALTSELERSLVQSDRVGVDMIEIRPGLAYSGVAAGTSLTRLSAGWQLGAQWWVTLNAGFCPGFQQFDYRNFGAGLEYRIGPSLIFSASAEPVQICLTNASAVQSLRYQLGTDIRWIREY